MEPEWGSVEAIIYDAMQDVLGDELLFWKIFGAMRERRKKRHDSSVNSFSANGHYLVIF